MSMYIFWQNDHLWVIDVPWIFLAILFQKGVQKEPKFLKFAYLEGIYKKTNI
jgi:hypothetical protein